MKNKFEILPILLLGVLFGVLVSLAIPNSNNEVENISVFTDTLILENQGQIDIYQVDDGKWIVISIDDLRYVVKKKRKTIVSDLQSLFARFGVPEKVYVKPVFK